MYFATVNRRDNMERNQSQKSQVNWYTVKVLFESLHHGDPIPQKLDKDYFDNSDMKLFEESIILVKATTIEQAYEIASDLARKSEHEYLNTYGELVKWQYVSMIHAYELDCDNFTTGTEIYSRFIYAKKENNNRDIIMRYYPEALD